jgi:hypothetical protein
MPFQENTLTETYELELLSSDSPELYRWRQDRQGQSWFAVEKKGISCHSGILARYPKDSSAISPAVPFLRASDSPLPSCSWIQTVVTMFGDNLWSQ